VFANDDRVFFYIVAVMLAALAVSVFAIWKAMAAAGDDRPAVCMTKEQARAKFKTSHLYWHTEHHCWDDHRGRRHDRPARKQDLANVYADANGVVMSKPRVKFVSAGEYNELDAALDRDSFFRGQPLPYWPPVIDPYPHFIPWEQRIMGRQ
jgi:hypothetical protein